MKFDNPWENISIELIEKNQFLQSYDTTINILYVLNGNATFLYEGKNIPLGRNDFIIVPKAKRCELVINDAKVFLCKFVYIISLDKLKKYHYIFEGNSVINGSSKSITVINVLQKIIQNYIFKEERPRFKIFKYYFELLSLLEEHFCKKEYVISDDSIYSKIQAISAYIKTNSEKEIKLSELAKQLYVSEQYLSRMFRKYNGENLSDFIISCRMGKVTNELISTDKTITDIAFSAGFININSFNRIFKNRYKMTPKEFRTSKLIALTSNNEDINNNLQTEKIKELVKESEILDSAININIHRDKFINGTSNVFIIGLGNIKELCQEPLFTQIGELKSLKFTYGRISGWFDSNLMFSGEIYDFFKIDIIIRKLLLLNIKPYIEINIFNLQMNEEKLLKIIENLFNNFVNTYGYNEVNTWIVDIIEKGIEGDEILYTNQLNISKQQVYFKSFECIARKIKEILPKITIGGGGIRIDCLYKSFINNFYVYSKNSEIFPTFLSTSLFQFDQKENKEFSDKISPDPNYIKRKIIELKKQLKLLEFEVNIILIDFNVTIFNDNVINDTAFIGNFILKNTLDIMNEINMIGYGNFSDYSLRNEQSSRKEIFGGRGLFSVHGLPKASYFSLLFFMNSMLCKVYIEGDVFISKNDNNTKINIIAFNYSHLGINYYYDTYSFHKYNINSAFENNKKKIYNIDLSNIIYNEKNYKAVINRFGTNNGSFLDEVNRYTKYDILCEEDVEYLKSTVRNNKNID